MTKFLSSSMLIFIMSSLILFADKSDDLIYCAKMSYNDYARTLLKGNINFEKVDEDGKSALQYAIENSNLELVELIIQAGASVNKPFSTYLKPTPLMLAASTENYNLCEFLLGKGADINAEDYYERTPYYYALKTSNKKLIALFEEYKNANDNSTSNNYEDNNYYSAESSYSETTNVSWNEKELLMSIERGDINGVKELIKAGIDLEPSGATYDNSYYNPIQTAVVKNNIEILKILVESTTNLDLNKIIGDSIIVALKNQKMMDYIISKGYDINTYFPFLPPDPEPTGIYLTPLGYAAYINNVKLMKYLFSKGASYFVDFDYNWYGSKKTSPLSIACSQGSKEVVDYLSNRKDISIEELSNALFFIRNREELAEILLKKGANCNYERVTVSGNGPPNSDIIWTPFYSSLSCEDFKVAKLMLKYNADVNQNIKIAYENRPMVYHFAKDEKVAQLEFLRKAGANMATLLFLESWRWWYCDYDEDCIEKVSLHFSNQTRKPVRQATIFLSIVNNNRNRVIYKKKHTIIVNLDKDETGSSQEFYLANKVFANSGTTFQDDYVFEVEVLSIK